MSDNNYVELHRTFSELPENFDNRNDISEIESFFTLTTQTQAITWDELLKENRVVILAEAGSGKTSEIRNTAKKIKDKGKYAFFFRLDDLCRGLEDSFEIGTQNEFQQFISSNEEAWILMDSVDEARLRDPRDFERAVKLISNALGSSLNRAHIFITSRGNAWRKKSDLKLCNDQFRPDEIIETVTTDEISHEEQHPIFKIVTLNDLNESQIRQLALARGILDTDILKFMEDIERQDAWLHTSRPQDLEELISYWNDHGVIGTKLDITSNSISMRLKERDQNRADVSTLTEEKKSFAAKTLAVAVTLGQKYSISVPDGDVGSLGVDSKEILNNWTDKECKELLGLPLFDEAQYGCVRFHHRSVREYLAAEWFRDYLKPPIREDIEELFIRTKYGIKVLTPSLRSVLGWLIIHDVELQKKALNVYPDLALESADCTRLSLEIRKKNLSEVCKKLAENKFSVRTQSQENIERFASQDISETVSLLLEQYRDKEDVVLLLLRMVWRGRLKTTVDEVIHHLKLDYSEPYIHILAIRALKAVGNLRQQQDTLAQFSKKTLIDKSLVAELVSFVIPDTEGINIIFDLIKSSKCDSGYSSYLLIKALIEFSMGLSNQNKLYFLTRLDSLASTEPHFEKIYCDVSKEFGWLLEVAIEVITQLLQMRLPESFAEVVYNLLVKIPKFNEYDHIPVKEKIDSLKVRINNWQEFKHKFFWYERSHFRKLLQEEKNQNLTDYYRGRVFGCFWAFNDNDLNLFIEDITLRELPDDKLSALSMAIDLASMSEDSDSLILQIRKQLREINSLELDERFTELTVKRKEAEDEYKIEEERRANEMAQIKAERDLKYKECNKAITENHYILQDRNTLEPIIKQGKCLNYQAYILDLLRKEADSHGSLAIRNTDCLLKFFPTDVIESFISGTKLTWRIYKPKLRSEGKKGNSIPPTLFLGLTGIMAEFNQNHLLFENIDDEEVEHLFRYAVYELNSFPDWFVTLYSAHQKTIKQLLLKEIIYEIGIDTNEEQSFYMIHKIRWQAQWLWNDIARELAFYLNKNKCLNGRVTPDLIKILSNTNSLSDFDLQKVSEYQITNSLDDECLPIWFACLIGSEPNKGLRLLNKYLKSLESNQAEKFMMKFIVALVGSEHGDVEIVRKNFLQPKTLKALYSLSHKHIDKQKDQDMLGEDHIITLRENAQLARDNLIKMLSNIPGKATIKALKRIVKKEKSGNIRSYIQMLITERAEQDADLDLWSINKFQKFTDMCNNKIAAEKETLMHLIIKTLENILLCFLGILVLGAVLYFTMENPDPSISQLINFRTAIALAAGLIAANFAGNIELEGKLVGYSIQATGGGAVFFIVYFFNPAIPS